jgi:hypothetical protein
MNVKSFVYVTAGRATGRELSAHEGKATGKAPLEKTQRFVLPLCGET